MLWDRLFGSKENIKKLIFSFLATIAVCTVFILISSGAVLAAEDPASYTEKAAFAALFTSSFVSGIISSRITKAGITSGIVNGVFLVLLLSLISVIFFGKTLPLGKALLLRLAVIGISSVGSITMSGKRSVSPRKKYAKMRR